MSFVTSKHFQAQSLEDFYPQDHWGFSGGSDGKESTPSAGDLGLIPGLGRSPGEGNGYPLQYSGLENSMGRGAWQVKVHLVNLAIDFEAPDLV